MATQNLYKGFSSQNYQSTGTFLLTDIELVKRDLLNNIYTRKGERRGMCGYGSIIPDVPFEMLDDSLIEAIHNDLERIFDSDPRVQTLSIDIVPSYDNNSLTVTVLLRYVELKIVDTLVFDVETSAT